MPVHKRASVALYRVHAVAYGLDALQPHSTGVGGSDRGGVGGRATNVDIVPGAWSRRDVTRAVGLCGHCHRVTATLQDLLSLESCLLCMHKMRAVIIIGWGSTYARLAFMLDCLRVAFGVAAPPPPGRTETAIEPRAPTAPVVEIRLKCMTLRRPSGTQAASSVRLARAPLTVRITRNGGRGCVAKAAPGRYRVRTVWWPTRLSGVAPQPPQVPVQERDAVQRHLRRSAPLAPGATRPCCGAPVAVRSTGPRD
jgi:hypothetical protein